jgi:atlastin
LQIYRVIDGEYTLDLPVIKNIFNKVGNRKIAIYSINGPLRSGKSFILNIFLKYLASNGSGDWINNKLDYEFKFRGGSERETVGIYIWSEPFILKKNDQEVGLILMDTQGIFDNKTTMQENAIVFALSALLSSLLIFNVKEQVSEDILQFLQCFTEMAKLKTEEKFQNLLFFVRDWQKPDYKYGYYDSNNGIKGRNFKRDLLDINDCNNEEVKAVHEMVFSSYSDVACYLMPHPGKELARNSNLDLNKLDPYFLCHISKLMERIFENNSIIEKRISGSFITGNKLSQLIDDWVVFFSKGEMPQLKPIYETAAVFQHEKVKNEAIEHYKKSMQERLKIGTDYVVEGNLFEEIHGFDIFLIIVL